MCAVNTFSPVNIHFLTFPIILYFLISIPPISIIVFIYLQLPSYTVKLLRKHFSARNKSFYLYYQTPCR